jgi:hypothetical protein
METLSFILGIAFVVVVAVAIVAVYAFVRVGQIKEELNSIHQVIGSEIDNQNRLREDVQRHIETSIDNVYSSLNEKANLINRIMDSRFDKLENKISEQIKK